MPVVRAVQMRSMLMARTKTSLKGSTVGRPRVIVKYAASSECCLHPFLVLRGFQSTQAARGPLVGEALASSRCAAAARRIRPCSAAWPDGHAATPVQAVVGYCPWAPRQLRPLRAVFELVRNKSGSGS